MLQTNALPRTRPEVLGVSPRAISTFMETILENKIGLHSFMLLRHGQVAAEAWWTPYVPERPQMLFSLSKSFTSTAIGLAVAEGRLSVDDNVVSFFPNLAVIDDIHLKTMRVRHLLSMSTGHTENVMKQMRTSNDWVQAFFKIPVEYKPGTHFVYNNAASYILSAIVQKITGETLLDYLQPRLLMPLNIQEATWQTCPLGINTGGWGLSLKTEDIARFGQLYLQKGLLGGNRILPEAWVDEATSFHISNGDGGESDRTQGYGYQFWRCRHNAYRAAGAYGQFCIVMPEQNAVLAITAAVKNAQQVLSLVWQHLLPGMSDQPVPTNDEEYSALHGRINSLSYPPLSSKVVSPIALRVSGKRIVFEENELKLRSASVRFEGDECTVTFLTQEGEQQVCCGIGNWVEGQASRWFGHSTAIVASGMWRDAAVFEMEWRFLETPFIDFVTCQFDDNHVRIEIARNVGGPSDPFILRGRLE